ncbi:hypothetical protein TNCV_4714171 [Trichonephila clavipes]|nr:hypothetical protein TNCV_4714171 [Trichonephila clavipes]
MDFSYWNKLVNLGVLRSPSQYSGYDSRLVTEWVRIRVKHDCFSFGKEVGLLPVMNSHPSRKAAHPFLLYMLGSSSVVNVHILLLYCMLSVLLHMFPG